MEVLLNGFSISAKKVIVAVLHDGKNDVIFWLLTGLNEKYIKIVD